MSDAFASNPLNAPTLFDKWGLLRFYSTYPEDTNSITVELRRFRIKEDGTKEWADTRASFFLDKSDPAVEQTLNDIVALAKSKARDLGYNI